jgi:hypothetical protein
VIHNEIFDSINKVQRERLPINMSFSLYGDLPKPKSSKGEDNKGEDGTNSVANGWAAVAPTPKPSSNEVATAAAASTSASSTEQPKPSGID